MVSCTSTQRVLVSLTILAELREEHAKEGVGDEFGPRKQGVQVEPLVAQLPHRQPVLTEVTDVRLHQPEIKCM